MKEKKFPKRLFQMPPDECQVLIAFARSAAKAQEIEALLQETLIIVEVAGDTRNRSLQEISDEIERLTLGQLKQKYLDSVIGKGINDPSFAQMWKDTNEARIFLMHKFFHEFPLSGLGGNASALARLTEIDNLLDIGRRMLNEVLERTLGAAGIPRPKLREFLKSAVRFCLNHDRRRSL